MKVTIVIISIILTVPIFFVFYVFNSIKLIATAFIYINQFITAFFAFKLCIDTSTKADDYLYNKKASKIIRTLEFILFLILTIILSNLAVQFFRSVSDVLVRNSGNVFTILFWISLILIGIALFRFIFTKKFATYITMFYLLTFFYVLYVFLDVFYGWYYRDNRIYDTFSFVIDVILFLYIMGSIFERVDYIQNKLKIISAYTVGLFVISMKLVVQINKIRQEIGLGLGPLALLRQISIQTIVLLWFFIIFILIIGIYYIFKYKSGNNQK